VSLTLAHSIWTAFLLIIFIAIVIWAWSGRRRERFERAARLPLEDDDRPGREPTPAPPASPGDHHDG
jgi:cytochrome c oxidase cbb3-type subunit 4